MHDADWLKKMRDIITVGAACMHDADWLVEIAMQSLGCRSVVAWQS